MNPWPVYEAMKQHWRETGNRLTEQEVRWRLPEATREEIKEGMIEFNLAYEESFKYEAVEDVVEMSILGIQKLFKQLEAAR